MLPGLCSPQEEVKWFKKFSKSNYYQSAIALLGEDFNIRYKMFTTLYGFEHTEVNVA